MDPRPPAPPWLPEPSTDHPLTQRLRGQMYVMPLGQLLARQRRTEILVVLPNQLQRGRAQRRTRRPTCRTLRLSRRDASFRRIRFASTASMTDTRSSSFSLSAIVSFAIALPKSKRGHYSFGRTQFLVMLQPVKSPARLPQLLMCRTGDRITWINNYWKRIRSDDPHGRSKVATSKFIGSGPSASTKIVRCICHRQG